MEIKGEYCFWDRVQVLCGGFGLNSMFAVLGLLLLAFFLWTGSYFVHQDGSVDPFGLFCLVGVLVVLGMACLHVRRRWRMVKQSVRGGEGLYVFRVRANGLQIESPSEGTHFLPWACFRNWNDTPKHFLLTMSDGHYEFVPKRFFVSRADQMDFRQILHDRIVIRSSSFGINTGWLSTVLAFGELLGGLGDE